MNITGLMIYYYIVCQKKLWYHLKNMNLEQTNENVGIGKLLDEESYSREKKHIDIDGVINIDFLRDWKVLHDIKKSRSIEEASIWQMKYYIYYLRKKGVSIDFGIIDYPLIKQRQEVYLLKEDESSILNILQSIQELSKKEKPPVISKQKICPRCAYYEYCYC